MTTRDLNTYCNITQGMIGLCIFIIKTESPKGDSQKWFTHPIARRHGVCEMTVNILLSYTFFKIALINLGETCPLKRVDIVTVLLLCCYDCDCKQPINVFYHTRPIVSRGWRLRLWITLGQFEFGVMNIHSPFIHYVTSQCIFKPRDVIMPL